MFLLCQCFCVFHSSVKINCGHSSILNKVVMDGKLKGKKKWILFVSTASLRIGCTKKFSWDLTRWDSCFWIQITRNHARFCYVRFLSFMTHQLSLLRPSSQARVATPSNGDEIQRLTLYHCSKFIHTQWFRLNKTNYWWQENVSSLRDMRFCCSF